MWYLATENVPLFSQKATKVMPEDMRRSGKVRGLGGKFNAGSGSSRTASTKKKKPVTAKNQEGGVFLGEDGWSSRKFDKQAQQQEAMKEAILSVHGRPDTELDRLNRQLHDCNSSLSKLFASKQNAMKTLILANNLNDKDEIAGAKEDLQMCKKRIKQQNDDIEELKLKIQAERDRVEKEQVREKQRIDKVKRILNTNQSTPMHSDEEGDEVPPKSYPPSADDVMSDDDGGSATPQSQKSG